MKNLTSVAIRLLFALTMVFVASCGVEEAGPTAPVRDPAAAQAKVDSANGLLEDVLMDLINDTEVDNPDDVDLHRPYNAYLDALRSDDSHAGANFGAGLLEVVMLSQDAEVQDFYDRVKVWGEALDDSGFFDVTGPHRRSAPRLGPVLRLDEVTIPLAAPVNLSVNLNRTAADGDPTITEFQNLLVTELVPRLETAAGRLKRVTEHADFKFSVTPRMMGDSEEDPVELDLTEVYASISALEVQLGLLYQFCAYNYYFSDYTGEELQAALTQGSPFLALHPEGAQRMQAAGLAWLEAVNSLESGINFLENEGDYQGDDLIKIDSDDGVTLQELDSLKSDLAKARRTLTGTDEFSFDTENGEEIVAVSLQAFFNTPVQDWKAMLPTYTVSLDTVANDYDYVWGDTSNTAQVVISSSQYYQWYRSANYEDGERYWFYENINFYVPEWEEIWGEWEAELINKPNAYLSFSYYGEYLDSGQYDLTVYINFSYDGPTGWGYAPRITWQADRFEDWIFPDPTLRGLLPGMTDQRFKEIFDMSGEGWEKSELWNFWDHSSPTHPRPPGG